MKQNLEACKVSNYFSDGNMKEDEFDLDEMMQTASYILFGKHHAIGEYDQVSSFQERSPLKEISPLSQNLVSNLNKKLNKKFMLEEEKTMIQK